MPDHPERRPVAGPGTAPRLTFIGFGEAGRCFAEGLAPAVTLAAWDLKLAGAEAAVMSETLSERGVVASPGPAEALAGAGAAFCLVTADQAEAAASAAADGGMPSGLLWLDGNSCSPGAKQQAAARIEGAGGAYVDVAIMAPVHPQGLRVPLLLSGPHADAALTLLEGLGMNARVVGDRVGQASAVKMLRSVVVKGLEAVTAECLLAARASGVDDLVLTSLQASDPGWDWAGRSAYNLERMTSHGARRAAEMREVARFLGEIGLPADMAQATVLWQDRLGALDLDLGSVTPSDRVVVALGALRAEAGRPSPRTA